MAANFGLSADWSQSPSVPDYAGAMSGLANVFAVIGGALGQAEQRQTQNAQAQTLYGLQMRQQMHKETMDILNLNAKAAEVRYLQGMEALKTGMDIQKMQMEMSAVQRNLQQALASDDYLKRHPGYQAEYARAVHDQSKIAMYRLHDQLSKEPAITRTTEGAELYKQVNTAVQTLAVGDGPGAKSYAQFFKDLDSGNIDAARIAYQEAKTTPEKLAAIELARKGMKNGSTISDLAVGSILAADQFKFLSTEETKQKEEIIAGIRTDYAKDLRVASKFKAQGDDTMYQETLRAMNMEIEEVNRMFHYPNSVGKTLNTPEPKVAKAEVDDIADFIAAQKEMTIGMSLTSDFRAQGLLQFMADPNNGVVDHKEILITPSGPKPFIQADLEDQVATMVSKLTSMGRTEDANAYRVFYKDVLQKKASVEDVDKLYQLYLETEEKKNPDITDEKRAIFMKKAAESMNYRAASALDKLGPKKGGVLAQYLARLGDVSTGATVGAGAAKLGFGAEAGVAAGGAVTGIGALIGGAFVATMAGGSALDRSAGYYDPTSGGVYNFEAYKSMGRWLAGEGYLTKGDLANMQREVEHADVRRMANAHAESVLNVVKVARDPRTTKESIETAVNNMVLSQGALQLEMKQSGVNERLLTSAEHFLPEREWKYLTQRYQILTGVDLRQRLTPSYTSGMTSGSTGAVSPAPAGGTGQASWAIGIPPTGTARQP